LCNQLGIVLTYPAAPPRLERTVATQPSRNGAPSENRPRAPALSDSGKKRIRVGIIGAGLFTKLHLLPQLKKTPVELVSIASATGTTAALAARKFGIRSSTTDYQTIIGDPHIDAVFITTPNNSHVRIAVAALQAGKHVFVEKPAAINRQQLAELRSAYEATRGLQLMVGFNRRFSSHAVKMKSLLRERSQPACCIMTVNAGYLPRSHWQQDMIIGGGRIIGEGCHFVDLLRFIVDRPITEVAATMIGPSPGVEVRHDKMSIALRFADGSIGTIHYLANGHKSVSKERLEVFCEGRVLQLNNFRTLTGYGWPQFKRQRSWMRQDKGREAEIQNFVQRVQQGGEPLMPPEHIWNVTEATFAAMESAEGAGMVALTDLSPHDAAAVGLEPAGAAVS
jgi:predicted dehydrogenase